MENPTTELSGVTYSWGDPTPVETVDNAVAGTGQDNVHGEELTLQEGTTSGVMLTYTVTPTLGICQGNPGTVTVVVDVTVHPVPSISAQPVSVCPNANTVPLSANLGSVEATTDTLIWILKQGEAVMAKDTAFGVSSGPNTWAPTNLQFACGTNYT